MFPHWGVTEDFCPQHCKILWLKCITVHMLKCFLTGVTEFLSTKLQNSLAEVNHSMQAEVFPHWGDRENFCQQNCKILLLKWITVCMLKCILCKLTQFSWSEHIMTTFAFCNVNLQGWRHGALNHGTQRHVTCHHTLPKTTLQSREAPQRRLSKIGPTNNCKLCYRSSKTNHGAVRKLSAEASLVFPAPPSPRPHPQLTRPRDWVEWSRPGHCRHLKLCA